MRLATLRNGARWFHQAIIPTHSTRARSLHRFPAHGSGSANGEPMGDGFHELVAHAAQTRSLVAGTVIGSGTVSNENFRECGSSCIAERRGIEIVDEGVAKTEFMRFGDRVRMQGTMKDGRAPFRVIDQKVVKP